MLKHKIRLKKYLLVSSMIITGLLALFLAVNIREYHTYTRGYNEKLARVLSKVKEQYPGVSETDLIRILNDGDGDDINFLKYGIDPDYQSLVYENDRRHRVYMYINGAVLVLAGVAVAAMFLLYERGQDKRLMTITRSIEQINKKNYRIEPDTMSEDELSILRNELYKITVMLKEDAENSKKEKLQLKDSLQNISHQLKTPLTSIMIMLENMLDDPEMEPDVREEFLGDIRREAGNINFLVQSILKLSKLDTNTVTFLRRDIMCSELAEQSVERLEALCDLKNVSIDVNIINDGKLYCDPVWQTEALTNIIKNCVEHSSGGGTVNIEVDDNKLFSRIKITDHGEGIAKEDLPHIFERFYKGRNAAPDSVGIGLALAKAIIVEDKGSVSVCSDESGTVFEIKYFRW